MPRGCGQHTEIAGIRILVLNESSGFRSFDNNVRSSLLLLKPLYFPSFLLHPIPVPHSLMHPASLSWAMHLPGFQYTMKRVEK